MIASFLSLFLDIYLSAQAASSFMRPSSVRTGLRNACLVIHYLHCTDPMQLVDELSMIYTTCLMFYATFSHNKAHPIPLLLGIFLVSLAVFITGYYHYLQDPAFHQNAYAILTAIVLFRSMYVMEVSLRPTLTARQTAHSVIQEQDAVNEGEKREQKRQDDRDRIILKTMWTMIAVGLGVFLGGFGIWNLDNIYCGTLRRWRHDIGLPWGILLEGHGWWYVQSL